MSAKCPMPIQQSSLVDTVMVKATGPAAAEIPRLRQLESWSVRGMEPRSALSPSHESSS